MDWVNTGRGPQGDDFRGLEVVDSRDLVSNKHYKLLTCAYRVLVNQQVCLLLMWRHISSIDFNDKTG